MRKLNLEGYSTTVLTKDSTVDIPMTSNEVKQNVIAVMFHPELRHTGLQQAERFDIRKKVMAANGSILLEDADWSKMKQDFEQVPGLGEVHQELYNRVINAPVVEPEEKKSKK